MLRSIKQKSTDVVDLDATMAWLKRLPQPVRAPAGRRWVKVPAT